MEVSLREVLDARERRARRQQAGASGTELQARKCLICGKIAQVCARSRAHSVAQLQEKTTELLESALIRYDTRRTAQLACQTLLYEVAATLKPEEGLEKGLSLNDAGCAALLAMMASAVDTNLIARSDYETQQRIARETAALLKEDPFPGEEVLKQMDAEFREKNLSPGGSADLLAMTYFLHLLKKEAN